VYIPEIGLLTYHPFGFNDEFSEHFSSWGVCLIGIFFYHFVFYYFIPYAEFTFVLLDHP